MILSVNPVCQIVIATILTLAAAVSQGADVTVFAAASLTDALRRIAANYEKSSGDIIVFNFAASGTLARQIEAGATACPTELPPELLVASPTQLAGGNAYRSELGFRSHFKV
jgi:hypothetical protein